MLPSMRRSEIATTLSCLRMIFLPSRRRHGRRRLDSHLLQLTRLRAFGFRGAAGWAGGSLLWPPDRTADPVTDASPVLLRPAAVGALTFGGDALGAFSVRGAWGADGSAPCAPDETVPSPTLLSALVEGPVAARCMLGSERSAELQSILRGTRSPVPSRKHAQSSATAGWGRSSSERKVEKSCLGGTVPAGAGTSATTAWLDAAALWSGTHTSSDFHRRNISTASLRAVATIARFLPLLPPRSARAWPQRRRSQSCPSGPRIYWAH